MMERKEKKREKKRIVKIVVHYHGASQPPERRLTGTPTSRANFPYILLNQREGYQYPCMHVSTAGLSET